MRTIASFGISKCATPLIPTPQRIDVPPDIASEPLPSLTALGHTADEKLIPKGGTTEARQLLNAFFDYRRKAEKYYWQLSYPGANATTGLSPHIKYGAISIRECVQTVVAPAIRSPVAGR